LRGAREQLKIPAAKAAGILFYFIHFSREHVSREKYRSVCKRASAASALRQTVKTKLEAQRSGFKFK